MPNPLYALSEWRHRRGLSVDELATRAGVSAPTLRRLERGSTPTYATTRAVARALRVRPVALMQHG